MKAYSIQHLHALLLGILGIAVFGATGGSLLLSTAPLRAANNPTGDPPCNQGTPCTTCEETEDDADSDGGLDGDPTAITGNDVIFGGSATNGSIQWTLPLGRGVFPRLSGGVLKVRKAKPTPGLYDPEILFYTNNTGRRIVNEETGGGSRTFRFINSLDIHTEYRFSSGATVGTPINEFKTSKTLAYLLNAAGNVVPNAPENGAVFLELRFQNGKSQRFSLETKNLVGVGSATGQYLAVSDIAEAARVDVMRESETLRQIKAPDGFADITRFTNENGFYVKLYAPLASRRESERPLYLHRRPLPHFYF
jgi:hypothetical protein